MIESVKNVKQLYVSDLKGLNFLIPLIDKVKYLQSLKEIVIDIPEQSAITKDNVTLRLAHFFEEHYLLNYIL